MELVGRVREQRRLRELCDSGRPEFVVVYGRRRVGKTYLVREFFDNSFSFYTSGAAGGKAATQLASFNEDLVAYGHKGEPATDWFEAFRLLRDLLERDDVRRDRVSGRRIVFIDELPWLDTPRSNFRSALELFWNKWGSAQEDLMLVVCGSATSWIVKHLFKDRGGLHNRVTARVHLEPFTLGECEEYARVNGLEFTRRQLVQSYMVFGGIPYYLNLMSRRLGFVQNVDYLCFSRDGELRGEFDELYRSLFKSASSHVAVVRALAGRAAGLTRQEVADEAGLSPSGGLTTVLEELESCGFVRRYRDFTKKERGAIYQLVDPFSLFYLRFVEGSTDEHLWANSFQSARVRSWEGYAFELVCLLHVGQIRAALGISGVATTETAWRSEKSSPAAQIDLVIDRADGIVNLCEMKWCDGPYTITKKYGENLRNKRAAFVAETRTRKAQHLTLVTPDGLMRNAHAHEILAVVTEDDLFT